ncbi:MAG: hypothetical protein CL908_13140 [Deltaproteobacteria bacterium]|nr:hypothetical protein [Deltaproteobacteria bacterium]
MAPDFLCIGAQKAGTTWLQENLSRHPEIWLPPPKELHYFDHPHPSLPARLFNRKKNHLRKARAYVLEKLAQEVREFGRPQEYPEFVWAFRYCFGHRSDAWYESLFPEIEGKIRGEVCPGYARVDLDRVAQIAQLMPNAKIIYLLRNPVERAWSSLSMHFRKGGDQLIDAVSEEEVLRRFEYPKTRRHADYAANLENWSRHFSEEQLMVGFFEDLRADPRRFLESILHFLGVRADDAVLPEDVASRRNAGRSEVMPAQVARALARTCLPEAQAMHALFGNEHTSGWLADTERWAAG